MSLQSAEVYEFTDLVKRESLPVSLLSSISLIEICHDIGPEERNSKNKRMLERSLSRLVFVFFGSVLPTMAVPNPKTKHTVTRATNILRDGPGESNVTQFHTCWELLEYIFSKKSD